MNTTTPTTPQYTNVYEENSCGVVVSTTTPIEKKRVYTRNYETILMFRDFYLIPRPGRLLGSRYLLHEYQKWCRDTGIDKLLVVKTEKKWGTLIREHKIFRRERKRTGRFICDYALPTK